MVDMEVSGEDRLPPIKFAVAKESPITRKYSNSLNFRREVLRVFVGIEGISTKIKRTIFHEGIGKIITDDPALHAAILNSNPCKDAFDKGISFINTLTNGSNPKIFSIKILNVNPDYDNDNEFKDILIENGIINWSRIKSKSSHTPTSIISAELDDYEKYKSLIKGHTLIKVAFGETLKIVPKFLIKQCFNCFKIGHLKKDCVNEKVCINCSTAHPEEDSCRLKQCANCGGDHCSVSRKCEVLKEAADVSLRKLKGDSHKPSFPSQKENYWSKKGQTHQHNNQFNPNEFNKTNLITQVSETIQSTLENNNSQLYANLVSTITETVKKSIESNLVTLINQIIQTQLDDSLKGWIASEIDQNLEKRRLAKQKNSTRQNVSTDGTPNSSNRQTPTQQKPSQTNQSTKPSSNKNANHNRNQNNSSLNNSIGDQHPSKKSKNADPSSHDKHD